MNTPPIPPAVVTVYFANDLWRVRSDDGVFEGTFTNHRTAVREAAAAAEAHPGWVLVVAVNNQITGADRQVDACNNARS